MNHGPDPGQWQRNPAEQQQAFGEQPTYPAQAWPAGPGTGEPGQPVPPGYGQPGYGQPGYGQPGYEATGFAMPGYGTGPYGTPPPTHMIWARAAAAGGVLFNLILGLPAALIAVNYARKVRQHWDSGDQQAALAASRMARIWAIVSTVLDLLGVVLVIVLIAAGSSKSNFNNPAVVAASIKTQLQKRISDPSSAFYAPGLKVTSVVCTSIATNTDRCIIRTSKGKASVIAVISANGERYVTR